MKVLDLLSPFVAIFVLALAGKEGKKWNAKSTILCIDTMDCGSVSHVRSITCFENLNLGICFVRIRNNLEVIPPGLGDRGGGGSTCVLERSNL